MKKRVILSIVLLICLSGCGDAKQLDKTATPEIVEPTIVPTETANEEVMYDETKDNWLECNFEFEYHNSEREGILRNPLLRIERGSICLDEYGYHWTIEGFYEKIGTYSYKYYDMEVLEEESDMTGYFVIKDNKLYIVTEELSIEELDNYTSDNYCIFVKR